MKKILLWLDDIRNPDIYFSKKYISYKIVWCHNYDEFVDWINNNGLPAAISFDHDLGEEGKNERSGYTAAKFLVNYCLDNNLNLPEYSCHSSNPAGRDNILCLLNNFNNYVCKNK